MLYSLLAFVKPRYNFDIGIPHSLAVCRYTVSLSIGLLLPGLSLTAQLCRVFGARDKPTWTHARHINDDAHPTRTPSLLFTARRVYIQCESKKSPPKGS